MRQLFPILAFFLSFPIIAAGQNRLITEGNKQPYFQVDSFTVDFSHLILSPDRIESINVFKDDNAIAAYGDKAKYGAVIIKTKPNTTLLRISDVLEKYNLSKEDKELRVCLNKVLISRPVLALIEANEILGIEITMERLWVNPEDATCDERFINIKTSARK